MAKYLYIYHGGGSMPQSKEEIDIGEPRVAVTRKSSEAPLLPVAG